MTGFDYPGRVARLQTTMVEEGVDAVVLSIGADLPYFTGYEAMDSERPTVLIVSPSGIPVLVIPLLEAPRVEATNVELASWQETEDPMALVARALDGARHVAIGDQTRSSTLLSLQEVLPGVTWLSASKITSILRIRKDPDEVEMLRSAASAVDRALHRIPAEVRFSGRPETEIARDLQSMTVEEGHDVAMFAIVGGGPNGASPHHEPGMRVIEPGDLVVCDFGGRRNHYTSDVTRTFAVGKPSPEQEEVHRVVLAASEAARGAVKPGVPCQEIDRAARRVVEEAGFGDLFIHRTGHGIGLEVHEHPYMVEGNETRLEEGMTFSIEPGVYLPGRFGVRIEDIVACGVTGVDELNRADRSLRVVE
ncbi:MAG TPA: Xaa-Pro peptidase family protein [Acidimicrobiia bacterium]|nr:Xaa-Pro peptidase family protein [Acidimicrobiia bacterium]